MRIVNRIVGIIVVCVAMLASAPPVSATGAQLPPTIVLNPNIGPVGSYFTATWSNFPTYGCYYMQFLWDQTVIAIASPYSSGRLTASVPGGSSVGTHYIQAVCEGRSESARAPFKVVAEPEPTTTRPPVEPTRPPDTTTAKPKPKPVTTTTPPATTPPLTTPSTPSTSDIPSSVVPSDHIVSDGTLELDRRSIRPGETLSARGKGCEANHAVLISSGGSKVGATMADETGAFEARVDFAKIEPGRHIVVAECGIVLTGTVDQIVTSSTGGGSSAVIVLVFFVLAGGALIRFT